MDCCSSSSYMDYRHHSMNSNFCYPYPPSSMLRSASPYPLGGPGALGGSSTSRYGAAAGPDYRSLGYPGGSPMGYDGYDKYYGGYHHHSAQSSVPYGPASYYGSYPTAYREYGGGYGGGGGGHYYGGHQSQSPYARATGALGGSYGAGGGGYHYPGARHYPLGHPFTRDSYYHAQHQQPHREQPYSSFGNPYGGHLPPAPYQRNGPPNGAEHSSTSIGPKAQQLQAYPLHANFGSTGSHSEPAPPSTTSDSSNGADGRPSPNTVFQPSPNGYGSPSSAEYGGGGGGAGPPSSSYAASSGDSPQHPSLGDARDEEERPPGCDGDQPPSTVTLAPTASSSQTAGGGATGEFPLGSTKDARMRRPKERKLQRPGMPSAGSQEGGHSSRTGSPAPANGGGNRAAAGRMKSLDALTSLCWPEGEQFSPRMRKHSNANGLKSKEAGSSRKEMNESDSPTSTASPSPRGVAQSGRRAKKQSAGGKQNAAKEQRGATEGKEKPPTGIATPAAPSVENKNVTPLPGFQQAFGSTEIGKFSEVFFNSSPTPTDHSPPMHEQHQQHQHQHQQDQRNSCDRNPSGRYESDVDTLSPQPAPWDPGARARPADPYEGTGGGGTGYNLQIGTSFHPAYFESSSYSSDHAVDSPLGNYFSEMTCNEFVN